MPRMSVGLHSPCSPQLSLDQHLQGLKLFFSQNIERYWEMNDKRVEGDETVVDKIQRTNVM